MTTPRNMAHIRRIEAARNASLSNEQRQFELLTREERVIRLTAMVKSGEFHRDCLAGVEGKVRSNKLTNSENTWKSIQAQRLYELEDPSIVNGFTVFFSEYGLFQFDHGKWEEAGGSLCGQ